MLLTCQRNLTTLQRRSMQRMGSVLMLTVCTNFANRGFSNSLVQISPTLARYFGRQHVSATYAATLSALSLLPILLSVWIAANYLKAESDEFVRTLVVRALLWGFAVTMAGDAVLGALTTVYPQSFPISLFNADLFFASTIIAFRLLRRGYQ